MIEYACEQAYNNHSICFSSQRQYNKLSDDEHLAAKSIKNIHGVLHKALQQAVANGYIKSNPSTACVLPKIKKAQIKPLEPPQISAFVTALDGEEYKNLFLAALFTGMRQSELLGLSWDDVDFVHNRIEVNKQLQKKQSEYFLSSPKSNKGRVIVAAPFAMQALEAERKKQLENKLKHADVWYNPNNFVFTDEIGGHLAHHKVIKHFKKITDKIGLQGARFHDLRHTYAVTALQAGDDIKTVQENLGHATAAFTLDVYGHATDYMKQSGADKMERYINSLLG